MADSVKQSVAMSPSRLLNLPKELQELVIAKYYEETSMALSSQAGRPIITFASLNLELTCKSLKDLSRATRGGLLDLAPKVLMTEDFLFVRHLKQQICTSRQFKWLRECIDSLHLTALDIERVVYQEDWAMLIESCKNLRNITIHVQTEKKCSPAMIQQYTPLDTDKSKLQLIADALYNDWEPRRATSRITAILCCIHKAWDEAMSYQVQEDGIFFQHEPDEDLVSEVVLTTVGVDPKGAHVYETVTTYELQGFFHSFETIHDCDGLNSFSSMKDLECMGNVELKVVHRICRVDGMEDSITVSEESPKCPSVEEEDPECSPFEVLSESDSP